jgi:maltose alpha-D-glucosyltransferase/alpha-amylase
VSADTQPRMLCNEPPEAVSPVRISSPFPALLEEGVLNAIRLVYGEADATGILARITDEVKKVRQQRPPELLKQDFNRASDWYKSEMVYMFYAERFGVDETGKPNTFKTLIPMLDYLKELGVTLLYILPFLDSPMIDAGFDVSDFRQVREDLGGNAEFELFLNEAKKRGFKIKADLILNHISDQHAWFQAALKGDAEKIAYFVAQDTPPRYQVRKTVRKGKVAVYTEVCGSKSHRRLMFPDIAKCHFRRETINGQDKHFYHTFYPHQLDLNWRNPNVLYEAIDIMGFWANKGIDIFRLDAIPFFVKAPGTSGENMPETHAVVQILSACLQAMSPATVIQAEACQWPKDIRPYYGEEKQYTQAIDGQGSKPLTRTNEVQIAYHFPFMPAIWASVVTADPTSFWKAFAVTPAIPPSATWAIFLRVHDELTLEMVDPKTRKLVYDALVQYGEPFREGLGVSGRLANFLDNDARRIGLIYSILLSLPGIPILYFGDEIGENNSKAFMLEAAAEREARSTSATVDVKSFVDTRDLGRAPIAKQRYDQAVAHPESFAGSILKTLKQLLRLRKQEDILSKGQLFKIAANDSHIFSYLRELNGAKLLIVHNLSSAERTFSLKLPPSLRASRLPAEGLPELQSGQNVPYSLQGKAIQLMLQPYQSYWLKLDAPTLAAVSMIEPASY